MYAEEFVVRVGTQHNVLSKLGQRQESTRTWRSNPQRNINCMLPRLLSIFVRQLIDDLLDLIKSRGVDLLLV